MPMTEVRVVIKYCQMLDSRTLIGRSVGYVAYRLLKSPFLLVLLCPKYVRSLSDIFII